MNMITIDGLKTSFNEFKKQIINKFYNKIEVDNKLNENRVNLESSLELKMNDYYVLLIQKIGEYDSLVDTTIQEKMDAKVFNTDGIITKEDLDPTIVITTNNLAVNNIATIDDINTITYMDSNDYNKLLTLINS